MRISGAALSALVLLALADDAQATTTRAKLNNTTNLDNAASWSGGLPTAFTQTLFSGYNQAGTLSLGSNATWLGIQTSGALTPVVIGTGSTLTLSNGGIDLSANDSQNLTINSGLALQANANQVWNLASGKVLTLGGTFTRGAGASVNVQGLGTVTSGSAIAVDATGIIGPWATIGTADSTRFATVTGNNIASYTGTSVLTTAITSSGATSNYEVAAVGALGSGAAFNTLRFHTGVAGAITGNYRANGILNASTNLLTMSGDVTIGATDANRELVVNSSGAGIAMAGIISDSPGGASALTKTGGSTLALSRDNSYSGITTISAGTVIVSHANGLGSTVGETIIRGGDNSPSVGGGSLQLEGGIDVAERLTVYGLGYNTNPGSVGNTLTNRSGNNTLSGAITLVTTASGTSGPNGVRIGVNASSQLTISGGITGGPNGYLIFALSNSASNLVFQQNAINLGSAGVITHDSSGTAVLDVAGNTWGQMTVALGKLRTDKANAIPLASTLAVGISYQAGGTVDFNGFDQSFGSLSSGTLIPGTRVITGGSGTLANITVNQTTSNVYSGLMTGNMSFTKAGGSSLSLMNGDNTYTGDTAVSGGNLILNNYAAKTHSSSTVAVVSATSATVTVGDATGLTIGQAITGTGIPANSYISGITGNVLTVTTPSSATNGTVAVTTQALLGSLKGSTLNYNAQGGNVVFGVSTTTYTLGGIKGSQSLSLQNSATSPAAVALTVGANNQSTTYSGGFTGSGSANKVGTGTLELTGASTHTGGVTVTQGTLLANNSSGASATGTGSVSTVVNSGAKLGGTGSITGGTLQSITLSAGTFLLVGSSHGVNSGGAQDLSLGTFGTPTSVAVDLEGVLQFDLFSNNGNTATNVLSENDLLRIYSSGTPDFTGSTLQVSATGLASTTWNIGDTWMLIDWSGVTNATKYNGAPTFLQTDLPALASGQMWTSSFDDNGFYISVAGVPEPSRALLMIAGLSAALLRRRRR